MNSGSFTSGLPTPTKGNLGELGLQHSNGRKWFCHHIPSPLPPAPPSPTPQQNLAKALGEQDPPLGEQPPNPVWSQNLDSKPLTHEEAPSGWGGAIRAFPGAPVVKSPPSDAGGTGLIPGQGVHIPHTSCPKKKPKNINKPQKQYCNKFNKDFKNGLHQKKQLK